MSAAGARPIQNTVLQASCGGSTEFTPQKASAASAQPTDQLLCTRPVALPRCFASIISETNIAPTTHSPPKPRPCNARVANNCPNDCAKPLKNVKTANQSTVSCRRGGRPKLPARMPANQPPIPEVMRAPVAMYPAWVLLMCHKLESVGMMKLYIIRSKP